MRETRNGRTLGCLSIVVGVIVLAGVLSVVAAVVATFWSDSRETDVGSADGAILSPTAVPPAASDRGATVGSCRADGGDVVQLVGCEQPHEYEVFKVVAIDAGPDDPWPVDAILDRFVGRNCDGAPAYVGGDLESLGLGWGAMRPTEDEWRGGVRTVECVVFRGDSPEVVTGSLRAG